MKAKSAKHLLAAMRLPMSAHSFIEGLRLAELVETLQYESTSGSGEIKEFNRLLDSATAYGVNKASAFHPVKTEMQFFETAFLDVYAVSCKALHEDAQLRLLKVTEGGRQ